MQQAIHISPLNFNVNILLQTWYFYKNESKPLIFLVNFHGQTGLASMAVYAICESPFLSYSTTSEKGLSQPKILQLIERKRICVMKIGILAEGKP